MTIKEVAEKFSLSEDTLRYYEKIRLLSNIPRTSGGMRDYGEQEMQTISFVKCMRSAGVSVEALKKYMSLLRQGNETVSERKEILKRERDLMKQRIDDMQEAYSKLCYKIDKYDEIMLESEKKIK